MSSPRVNKQRCQRDRRDSFGEAMSFHVAPLNPVSGTLGSFPELCLEFSLPGKFGCGIGCTGRIIGLQFGMELVAVRGPLATVRFEPSNRYPSSLKPSTFKLCTDDRKFIFQLSIADSDRQSAVMFDSRLPTTYYQHY